MGEHQLGHTGKVIWAGIRGPRLAVTPDYWEWLTWGRGVKQNYLAPQG